MPSKIKLRLSKAQNSVASWFRGSSRISTPQLIKRSVHVTYDHTTQTYHGLPARWQAELDKNPSQSTSNQSHKDAAKTPAESAQVNREVMQQPATGLAGTAGPVWFDQCTRRFVNLPRHWRERLQRNSLTDWAEFQRNPQLLTLVFSMMDEELRNMDLAKLGLDSSVYSTTSEGGGNAGSNNNSDDSSAASASSSSLSQRQTGHGHQTQAGESTATAAKRPPPSAHSRIVWTQQRSFAKDNDSDSEEVAEL